MLWNHGESGFYSDAVLRIFPKLSALAVWTTERSQLEAEYWELCPGPTTEEKSFVQAVRACGRIYSTVWRVGVVTRRYEARAGSACFLFY